MTRLATALALVGSFFLSSCGTGADQPEAAAPADAASASPEQALFLQKCGICHSQGGTGTMMLARRLGDEKSLLAEREDLTPEYIAAVVRHGLNSMPPITRVELTEAQLSDVSLYLTGKPLMADSAAQTGAGAEGEQP